MAAHRRTAVARGPVFAEIGRKKMVVLGADKLICDLSTEACQLFNLEVDPGEHHNLIGEEPALLARLRGLLDRSLAESRRFEQGVRAPCPPEPPERRRAPPPQRRPPQPRHRRPKPIASTAGRSHRAADAVQSPARSPAQPRGRRSLLSLIGPPRGHPAAPSRVGAVDPWPLWPPENLAISPKPWPRPRPKPARIARPSAGPPSACCACRLRPEPRRASPPWLPCAPCCSMPASMPGPPVRRPGPRRRTQLPTGPKAHDPAQTPAPTAWPMDRKPRPARRPGAADADRVRPLIDLFSRTRIRATQAVLSQLENVLSRADLVRALGTLGQVTAVPALVERLQTDPYVHVRAAAATALGQLAPASKPAATPSIKPPAKNANPPSSPPSRPHSPQPTPKVNPPALARGVWHIPSAKNPPAAPRTASPTPQRKSGEKRLGPPRTFFFGARRKSVLKAGPQPCSKFASSIRSPLVKPTPSAAPRSHAASSRRGHPQPTPQTQC